MRWTLAARETSAACRRTAKSCRSDAPMPVSSLREAAQATVSNKHGHRGEREVSRKTIARGMPGETGVTVVTTLVCLFFYTRGCGRIERPAFPAPSDIRGQEIQAKLARKAAARSRAYIWRVIARSKSDEAIQSPSFRGDAEHRTRNLEIPRCAIAHLRSGAGAPSRNDGVWIASGSLSSGSPKARPRGEYDGYGSRRVPCHIRCRGAPGRSQPKAPPGGGGRARP
jgi:hypothetical protein